MKKAKNREKKWKSKKGEREITNGNGREKREGKRERIEIKKREGERERI